MFKNIKLILSDCDGTLLDDNKRLDSEIKNTVKRLREKGIEFTLASGRNYYVMQDFLRELNINIPYICNNGANIFLGDKCIFEKLITTEDLLKVIDIFDDYENGFVVYGKDSVLYKGQSDILNGYLDRLKGKIDCYEYKKGFELDKELYYKVVLIGTDEDLAERSEMVNNTCEFSHCVPSENLIYTITHVEASKGSGLKFIIDYLGLKADETLVFGDSFNDISMAEIAEIAVSMEEGVEALKNVSDFVCGSNNKNGVSRFINENLL